MSPASHVGALEWFTFVGSSGVLLGIGMFIVRSLTGGYRGGRQ